jgi:hypothetical protein
MRMMRKMRLTSAAIAVATVAACGGHGAEPDAALLQDAKARRGIPQAVLDFESLAEDTYDTALSGNLAAVQKAAGALSDSWKKLRKTVVHDGLKDASVRALDRSVARLSSLSETNTDSVELARAANAVSDTMDDVFALYHPKVPPEILSLDFLGREIVLDCKATDAVAAARDLKTLEKEWAGLRPKVIKAGGSTIATDLDDVLRAARRALSGSDWAALQKQAEAALELVDSMEKKLRW